MKIDRDEAIRLRRDGYRMVEIADHFGATPSAVWAAIQKGPRPHRGPKPARRCRCGCGQDPPPRKHYAAGHGPSHQTARGHACRCGCGTVLVGLAQYAPGHQPVRESVPRPGVKVGDRNGLLEVVAEAEPKRTKGGSKGRSVVRCNGCGRTRPMLNEQFRKAAVGMCKRCYGASHAKPIAVGDDCHWWEVIAQAAPLPGGKPAWLCRCRCGREKVIEQSNLTAGATKRCRSCASRRLV